MVPSLRSIPDDRDDWQPLLMYLLWRLRYFVRHAPSELNSRCEPGIKLGCTLFP